MGEAASGGRRFGFTRLEARLDAWARELLDRAADRGVRAWLIEFAAFVAKQAWSSVFGFLLLVALVLARLLHPDDAAIARNDVLTVVAVIIQILMVATGLETARELRVIVLFHVVGTVMELFKTDVGSWNYDEGGVLRIAAVPLFSGFMYAAVGSYMVRVYRLFDLRFVRYPPVWATAVVAAAIYLNFFSHHFVVDLRYLLLVLVAVLWWRTTMVVRSLRSSFRLPLLAAFAGLAAVIWIAENVATWAGAWAYPDQVDGWEPVSASKLVSWFLLMIVSVVLVTWVYPPKPPDGEARPEVDRDRVEM
ncbi:DUF817 family protein [Herbiconiux sp. L3-i23]|uniref:DUF817 domain-containing protein n=1 Tax=Herbiconiux sp. L3-i23 TaxID=2905871 RepID=UPI00206E263A|nr:DUF817 family protein [Herbiconiux sp. L3-i23]BDI24136.1 hypothetical protein L3i23_29120 [Herbiconiux sp. L3-i23]